MNFFEYSSKQKAIFSGQVLDTRKYPTNNYKHLIDAIKAKLFNLKLIARDKYLQRFISKKAILIGTGGHAKVLVDISKKMGGIKIIGCVTNDLSLSSFCGYKIFLGDSFLEAIHAKGISYAILAIGDNVIRKKLANELKKIGYKALTLIDPSAIIADNVTVGEGTCIMAGAVINTHSKVGNFSILNTNCNVDHDNDIGDFTHIAPGCNLTGSITVGEGTLVGAGTSIKPGLTIGKWATLGVGSAVVSDIGDGKTCFGNPAKERSNK